MTAIRAPFTTPGGTSQVRVLERQDLPAALKLLAKNPVESVFVASRVRAAGVDAPSLGCPVWGFQRAGNLVAMCHAGANLVPVNADFEAVAAWAEFAGPERMCHSIIGPAPIAMELWQRLASRWGSRWSDVREVRPRQPVLAISGPPVIEPNPDVRRIGLNHWDAYYEAAVRMYTEEVGISPVQNNSAGYRFYVRQLITSGRAFGLVHNGKVIFKADVGSVAGKVCQLQGVWLDPRYRGRGMAAPAMATAVRLAQGIAPTVTLYVNDYNLPARATYARVGFSQVGEFATVHY